MTKEFSLYLHVCPMCTSEENTKRNGIEDGKDCLVFICKMCGYKWVVYDDNQR